MFAWLASLQLEDIQLFGIGSKLIDLSSCRTVDLCERRSIRAVRHRAVSWSSSGRWRLSGLAHERQAKERQPVQASTRENLWEAAAWSQRLRIDVLVPDVGSPRETCREAGRLSVQAKTTDRSISDMALSDSTLIPAARRRAVLTPICFGRTVLKAGRGLGC